MALKKTYPIIKANLVYAAANILGEGPIWHAGRQSFFWVDIEGKKLQEIRWRGKQVQSWPMPQRIGMLVPYTDTKLIIALQDGLAVFDLATSGLEWIAALEKDLPYNRPNDGKCDSEGRLWLGTMHVNAKEAAGSLYRLCKNEPATCVLASLTISNGMAWSPDNRYFYFTDSATYKIDRYLFNAASGNITFEQTAVTVPESMGMPDGMTVDTEGMLWVAHWDGFCVCRWHPGTGALLCKIELPVPQVTSCTFGGENMDILFITTASVGSNRQSLATYPYSGHVFSAQPGVKGLPPNKFQGKNGVVSK